MPDEIRPDSLVFFLYQNPGADEIAGRKLVSREPRVYEPHPPAPLIGATGYDLEHSFLPLTGLERGEVSLGNVIRCRYKGGNTLPPLTSKHPDIKVAIQHCQRAYCSIPASTRLLVAGGEYALYGLTGRGGPGQALSEWRGWMLPYNPPPRPLSVYSSVYTPVPPEFPVLIHYHLAYLYEAPWERAAAIQDWRKIRRYLDGVWPEPFPQIWTTPPVHWPALSAFDTEYTRDTGWWLRYSLAYRTKEGSPQVWVVERPDRIIPPFPTHGGGWPRIILHNTMADYPYLIRLLPHEHFHLEDTMFLHSVLWSDLDHTLDYLGSLYARTNAWKPLEQTNPQQYSAGDALGTYDSYIALRAELDRDPLSEEVYRRRLQLLPLWLTAQRVGIATNASRAVEKAMGLEEEKRVAQVQVEIAVGWPLNVGSPPQVAHHLYDVERVHQTPLGRQR